MNPTPADILEAAADVLEDEGWTQGRARDPETGGWCAHGALNMSSYRLLGKNGYAGNPTLVLAIGAVTTFLDPQSLVGFNDHPDTTMSDVVDAFKHTAKAVRNGEIIPRPSQASVAWT